MTSLEQTNEYDVMNSHATGGGNSKKNAMQKNKKHLIEQRY